MAAFLPHIKLSKDSVYNELKISELLNLIAIPLAAGILYSKGILLSLAVGALLMSLSTVIVAANANFLSIKS
ncbi:MAG: hypothetical protein JXA38_06805 [Methanosarcinaceae archaeon]|nr:hypothetical protein [Methanosarcinaceae archaeon]